MKFVKFATISTLLFGSLAISNSVSADVVGTRDTDAVVNFVENTDTVKPVDPTNPGEDITPVNPDGTAPEEGTAGPLSLDFASSIDFASNKISTKDEVYKAKAQKLADGRFVPNYAQVTDTRGTLKGWSLSVKQNGQFTSASGKVLTGAEISFSNGSVISISESTAPTAKTTFKLNPDGLGEETNVMAAANGQGGGTWVYRFGDTANIADALDDKGTSKGYSETDSVTLAVPAKADKVAEKYSTSLTWTLASLPANE